MNKNEEALVLVKAHENDVYELTLNRPKVLNALNDALIIELGEHLQHLAQKGARAIVLTGSAKAFAAGGDIAEMMNMSFADVHERQYVTSAWQPLEQRRIPMIAAVRGYAFGGGCELAMLCDVIVAGRSAVFAQPETSIGIIPGAGGTQRLVRAVGKAKAMDMILSGRQMKAQEAERCGLVSRVVDDEHAVEEAIRVAQAIAKRSKPVIEAARDAVNYAAQSALRDGLHYEQQRFYGTFALQDQQEGMQAFLEKRSPNWQDK